VLNKDSPRAASAGVSAAGRVPLEGAAVPAAPALDDGAAPGADAPPADTVANAGVAAAAAAATGPSDGVNDPYVGVRAKSGDGCHCRTP
jgi:hypothetical protein